MELEEYIIIAATAHRNQKDKTGGVYLEHPLRIMLKFHTLDEQIVAIMHDVIEDTVITLEDLEVMGVPKHLVDAIDAITKRDKETNDEYLNRCIGNPIAHKVKIADVLDNWSPVRHHNLDLETQKRLEKKYRNAMRILLSTGDKK